MRSTEVLLNMHACMLETKPTPTSLQPLLGFWKALAARVRSWLLPTDWHYVPKTFYTEKMLANEKDRQVVSRPWLIIHPYSCFRFYWDCLVLLVYGASLIYIPVKKLEDCPSSYNYFILFSDVINILAILINFLTGYVDKDGKNVILERRAIAKHYLKDTFILDLFTALPFRFIRFIHNHRDCECPVMTMMCIIKLARFIHVVRTCELLWLQWNFSYMWATFSTLPVCSIVFFHWLTFLHYQTPLLFADIYGREGIYLDWLKRYRIMGDKGEPVSVFGKYVTNLYYAAGVVIGIENFSKTDVQTQLIPELVLGIFIGLVGLVFVTYVFTTIMRILMYRYSEKHAFYGRLREIERYLDFKGIPANLRQKIQLYINYRYNDHYFREKHIWDTMNVQIKQEVNMFRCRKLLLNVPLFKDMPIALINTIIFNLKEFVYMPGEVLVKYGHPGTSLYLISSGTVEIMDKNGKEVNHLKDGAYFGERALLMPGTQRVATVIALEITEVFKLDHHDFQTCLQPCPRLKRRLFEDPEAILQQNRMRRGRYPPV